MNLHKQLKARSFPAVRQAISHLPKLKAGDADTDDVMHRTSHPSPLKLLGIKASRPGGYWREWPNPFH